MPSEHSSEVKFELGNVLFIDIVGYSKLLINEQSWHYSRCTDSDFFAIRKITHMSEEILSRILSMARNALEGF